MSTNSRYVGVKINKDRKYETTKIVEFKPSDRDRYIISRQGDRLDTLAQEIYNDNRYWWVIAEANNLGKGNFSIPPGTEVRLPRLTVEIQDKIYRLNSGG